MSTTTQTTVWCDIAGCCRWEMYDVAARSHARRQARAEGWTETETGDLCPHHSGNCGGPEQCTPCWLDSRPVA